MNDDMDDDDPRGGDPDAAEADAGVRQLRLSVPIPVASGSVSVLAFRRPNGFDFEKAGELFEYAAVDDDDAPARLTPRPKAMNRMISRLADVPIGSVRRMDGRDRQEAIGIIMGFMGTEAQPAPGAS